VHAGASRAPYCDNTLSQHVWYSAASRRHALCVLAIHGRWQGVGRICLFLRNGLSAWLYPMRVSLHSETSGQFSVASQLTHLPLSALPRQMHSQ
jgi:hypothetical protein